MSHKKLLRAKGRGHGKHFSMLIHEYFESREYALLKPREVKALIDVYCQYRGSNNGDLCATMKVMKLRGWNSNDELVRAVRGLIEKGWLMITRQGGRRRPTLYAVTFLAVNECGGKLDVKPTVTPPHLWKRPDLHVVDQRIPVISLHRLAVQVAPPGGVKEAA